LSSSHDTAATEIYTLSLHDALPISRHERLHLTTKTGALRSRELNPIIKANMHRIIACFLGLLFVVPTFAAPADTTPKPDEQNARSEEHTSELQSRENLVCRLLLEKK